MPPPSRALRLGVVAVVVAALLAGAALRDPWDPDETRCLQVTRELLEGGSPVLLTFNREPYSHKPPLFFWLLSPFVAAAGPLSAVAGAIPSLLSFLALALLAPRLGRSAGLSRAASQWGGLMAVTALLPAMLSGACRMDLLLVVWCVLALDRMVALSDPGSSTVRRDHLLLWLFVGLGVLTKGPIAVALPLLAAAALLPVDRRPLHRALAGPGPLLSLALISLWLVPAATAAGPGWLEAVVIGQTAGRVVDAFAHRQPWWFHLATLPGTLLPWAALAAAGLAAAGRRLRRLDPGLRLLAVYPVATVLLLSLLSGKTVLYPLPAFPAACLVAAWWLEGGLDRPSRAAALWLSAAAVAAVALGLGLAAPGRAAVEVSRAAAAAVAVSFLVPALAAGAALAKKRPGAALVALAWVVPSFAAIGFHALLPAFDRFLSLRPFAEAWVAVAPADQDEVLAFADVQPGYSLFTGLPTRQVECAALAASALDRGRLLVVKRKHLAGLSTGGLGPVTVRAEVPHRNGEILMVSR